MFPTGHEYQLYQYSRIRSPSPSLFSPKLSSLQTANVDHQLTPRSNNFLRGRSESKIDSMIKSLRKSITPAKNKELQAIKNPQQTIISSFVSSDHKSSPQKQSCPQQQAHKGFYRDLEKTAGMVFIRGNPDIILNPSDQSGSICVPKIINYCRESFDNLEYYLIATQSPVSRSHIQLNPSDYQILMRCPLKKRLKAEGCEKNVKAYGEWNYLEKDYLNFVLILFDPIKQQTLYWMNYLDTQKLIEVLKKSINGYRIADQLC